MKPRPSVPRWRVVWENTLVPGECGLAFLPGANEAEALKLLREMYPDKEITATVTESRVQDP